MNIDTGDDRLDVVLALVLFELAAATKKFPAWPTDPLHALAVLGEEVGELNKEVLQLCYEPEKSTEQAVRREALQAAAMSIRFLMSLDYYHYGQGMQHRLIELKGGGSDEV